MMQTLPISHAVFSDHHLEKDRLSQSRRDNKLVFPAWPMLKPSVYRQESRRAPSGEGSSPAKPEQKTFWADAVTDLPPGGRWIAKRKDAIVSKRRKASVPELGLMTTVQEALLDSPTIPGHLPAQIIRPTALDRSFSLPSDTLPTLSEDRTPRAADFPRAEIEDRLSGSEPTELPRTEVERRAQFLGSNALRPLIIPSTAPSVDSQPESAPLRANDLIELEDIPPKVPPKSPRTESRASPRSASRRPSHNKSGSSSTHGSAKSATSTSGFNCFGENSSPRPLRTPVRNGSPSPRHKVNENAIVPRPLAARHESPSRQLRDGADDDKRPKSNNRNTSSTNKIHIARTDASATPPISRSITSSASIPSVRSITQLNHYSTNNNAKLVTPTSDIVQKTASHQRGNSEPLHLNTSIRHRNLAGKDSNSIYGLIQTMAKSPRLLKGDMDLPAEFKATNATANVQAAEANALRRQAGRHVERFEVLQSRDVSMLSQELELLDERCAYLHNTHKSLRQGRRSLHMRMITYLKSPRMSKFSRHSILKQEEALAELDVSIDEWASKLEAAEDRRVQIRQRLLEHIAAAVTLQTVGRPIPAAVEEPTPPESPEEDNYIQTERRDVQSIKIYADEGVAALLAEIEKEIDSMADQGTPIQESR